MANFQFKLEPLLRHRLATEEQYQRELAGQLQQRTNLHDELRQMQQTISTSKSDLRDGLLGRVDLEHIAAFTWYSRHVTQRAHHMVVQLASIEKQIATAREKLMESIRARRVLELLREKQFVQWQLEQQRREDAELDDLALQRFIRSRHIGSRSGDHPLSAIRLELNS